MCLLIRLLPYFDIVFLLNIAGSYFASHFMMGGEKFNTVNPECFLFGENNDLNYLCNKPVPVSWRIYLQSREICVL